jgi:hypothetical protein
MCGLLVSQETFNQPSINGKVASNNKKEEKRKIK